MPWLPAPHYLGDSSTLRKLLLCAAPNMGSVLQVDALTADREASAKNVSQLQAACTRKDGALREQRTALEALHARCGCARLRCLSPPWCRLELGCSRARLAECTC